MFHTSARPFTLSSSRESNLRLRRSALSSPTSLSLSDLSPFGASASSMVSTLGEDRFLQYKTAIIEQLKLSPLSTLQAYFETGPNEMLQFTIYAVFGEKKISLNDIILHIPYLSDQLFGKPNFSWKTWGRGWIELPKVCLFLATSKQGVVDTLRVWAWRYPDSRPSQYPSWQSERIKDTGPSTKK